MAGKERGPFRPLGLRMQDFGRRLMRHYVPPQSTPPLQNVTPSPGWQADAQTPLIWDEPEQQGIPPVEDWSVDTPPTVEPPPEAPPPARRKAQPPAQSPTVQRKASSEQKIDPGLLAILAAHQKRETRVAEIRERKTAAASDLQRQITEGETEISTSRRRNRASFDYVETKALLPPEDEMGHTAPPKTPSSDVIQTARESNQPDDDDSEESSQAGIVDFDVSQPVNQASPAVPPALVQRTAEITPEPEELPQFPDDEPETEPVYPLVYGLPEFPRVAEEPELFGEREITPPPSEPGKPDAPISPSASPTASLQREADVTPIQYAADVPDAPPSGVQRQIDPSLPTRVQREENPSAKSPASTQPAITEPTADIPVWQGEPAETEWPPSTPEMYDRVTDTESVGDSVDALPFAQPSAQREIEPSDEDYWIEPEAEIESREESAPPVFDQLESPQTRTSPEQPVVQRKAQSPPDSSPVQSNTGQGDAVSDLYFDAAAYDQYTDTEPIENAFVQREFEDVQSTIDEAYGTDNEAEAAPDEFASPSPTHFVDNPPPAPERPGVQRKAKSPPSTSTVQPDSGQGDNTADASFENVSYSENVDMPSVESAFVQRDYEDVPPTIDEGYWTDTEAEAAPDEFASPSPTHFVDNLPPAPERPVVQRKTKAPSAATPVQPDQEQGDESVDFAFESLISDHVPVDYPDMPEQAEPPFADDWENLPFEGAADITTDAPHSPLMSSPPNQIARQSDFSQDIEQTYDAPSEEAEHPVDVFQALIGAGMIAPSDNAPRIDRQALPPDEENFSEEPYSAVQPVDLYQAMMNTGMLSSSASQSQKNESASDVEAASESTTPDTTPDRVSVQYAAPEPTRVMRVETETTTSESSSNGEQSGDVDIDKLARDVYSALRSRLRIEKERRG